MSLEFWNISSEAWIGWLTAIGTVGTAGVSVWLLRREQEDRRRRDARDRRDQASQVSLEAAGPGFHGTSHESVYIYELQVTNGSSHPIRGLTITTTQVMPTG